MKIGRNEPCPCGSGKKYKKCCIVKEIPQNRKVQFNPTDHYIAEGEIDDHGDPEINDIFFEENPFKELSPHKLTFSILIYPEIGSLAANIVKQQTSRWKNEEEFISRTNRISDLIALMKEGIDTLNHELLINKILHEADVAVPMIINELKSKHSNAFVELVVKIIYKSKIDCSSALLEFIRQPGHRAYTVSQICLLLGLLGSKDAVKPLWNCYHFFKAKYPYEDYDQGPLIGLYELALKHGLLKNGTPIHP